MSHDLSDFQADVIDRSQRTPVLVDFWAAWCGPCKMLAPVLEKLAAEAGGRWELVKIDTEAHPDLATRFGIRGIPNVKLFHQGGVIAEFSGALPESQLRSWLAEHLPTPRREAMARARALLQAGRAREAASLLRPLLAEAPSDEEFATLAARAIVFEDPATAEKLIADVPPGSAWAEAAALARTFATTFRALPGRTDLPDSPLRPRYAAAIEHLRRQAFDEGLTSLIDVLQEKPSYDQGQAKALCLAVFRHLGMRHEITEKHFRAYSMAVNV